MMMKREFTGRDAAIVFIGGFVVIIVVNVILTVFAVKSFPGLDVDNAYVESQNFDADKAAQERLGWDVDVIYQDGKVILTLHDRDGRVVTPTDIKMRVGRATTNKFDEDLSVSFDGRNYVVPHQLAGGKWLFFLNITAADGTRFHQIQEVVIRP